MKTMSAKELKHIAGIVELEKKLQCRNTSVVGGFAGYISTGIGALPPAGGLHDKMAGFVKAYRDDRSIPGRTQLIADIEESLGRRGGAPFWDTFPKMRMVQNSISLQSDVRYQKHVGEATAKKLEKLGVKTIGDLLYHFPHRYLDTSS